MKNSAHFILVLFIFAFACKKEESTPVIIKTGDKLSLYSDKIDTVSTKNPLYESNSIDINKDGKIDFELSVFAIRAMTGYRASSGISIIDSTFQFVATNDSISPKILSNGQVLDNNQFWLYKKYFDLAEDSYVSTVQTKSNYSYWNGQTGYIGIRNEYKKGSYKYGWLKISVSTYCTIYLSGYSFEE